VCVLPVSLEQFWTSFLQDQAPLGWIELWMKIMKVKEASATNWSPDDIPNQGKDHSRPDDNFRECYLDQPAFLMRCVSGRVPVKIMLKDSEANVKKF